MEAGHNFKDPERIKLTMPSNVRRRWGNLILFLVLWCIFYVLVTFLDKLFNEVGYIVNYWQVAKHATCLTIIVYIMLIILRNVRSYTEQ